MLGIVLLDPLICFDKRIRTIHCSFLEKVKSCPKIVHISFSCSTNAGGGESFLSKYFSKSFLVLWLTLCHLLLSPPSTRWLWIFIFLNLNQRHLQSRQLEVIFTRTVFLLAFFLFVCLPFSFLTAQRSSRSLVIGRSVGLFVGLFVGLRGLWKSDL